MGLVKSEVVFNEIEHTYTLNGQPMSGVTAILNKYLFGSKYEGISEATLKKAAAKGSLVHSQLQMYINGMPFKEELPETIACKALLKEKCIEPLEAEYLISDNQGIASSIDLVDKQYNIIDYKTTAKLDIEYLRWQLSIYATLFEMQNMGLQVNKMYAIHLREDKAELVEIKRLLASDVAALLECYYSGADVFDNPRARAGMYERELMSEYMENAKKLAEYDMLLKRQEEIKETLMACIDAAGDTDWKRDEYTIHYTPAVTYTTPKFNTDAFKKDHAKMYAKYISESETTRKGSVTIKIKEEEK